MTVRLVFGGDVMLGRRVAAVVASDPTSVFEGVRQVLRNADVAIANLEAPFGDIALGSEERLIADPAGAELLAAAGFDAMVVANNHAGDAGPINATSDALIGAGVAAVGLATTEGPTPVVVERNGVRVALLAFDLTRQGPPPDGEPGVAHWSVTEVRQSIEDAAATADLVAVGLHGGVEYLPQPDPALRRAVSLAVEWGADIVWAHGAHVTYGVEQLEAPGARSALAAYGLGNFLFDQRRPGTEEGLIVDVIATADGVLAYRVGTVVHADLRVSAPRWEVPSSSAVLLEGEWWSLGAPVEGIETSQGFDAAATAELGEVTAMGRGDVDGDGDDELVVAFLREFRPTLVNQRLSDIQWTDAQGRSAHLGVYEPGTMEQIWVAGSVPRPIVDLAVCPGTLAVQYGSLNGSEPSSDGSAWTWRDFGFEVAGDVTPVASLGCVDVDLDGAPDPVLLAPFAS